MQREAEIKTPLDSFKMRSAAHNAQWPKATQKNGMEKIKIKRQVLQETKAKNAQKKSFVLRTI